MLLELEQKLYSISAIRKALYELSDTFTHTIETNDTHFLLNLTLLKKNEVDEKEIETLVTNKINDYILREDIAKDTEKERNLILAYAFSRTNLVKDDE